MRFTGPEMMAMAMASRPTPPQPAPVDRDLVTAERLAELLHQYNRNEGYEAASKIEYTGVTKIDRAAPYTGDGLSRKWYQFNIYDQHGYQETGWMCVDDRWGFKYAEYLDSEDI